MVLMWRSKLRTRREPPSAPLPFEKSSLRWPCTRTSRFLKGLLPGHLLAAPRSPSDVPPPPSPPPSNGPRFRIRVAPQSDEDRDGSVPSPHRDPDADDDHHDGVDVDAAVDDDDDQEEKEEEEEEEEMLGIYRACVDHVPSLPVDPDVKGKPKASQKERRRLSNNGPAGAAEAYVGDGDDGPEILKPGVAHGSTPAVESYKRTLRPRGSDGEKAKAGDFRPSLTREEINEDFIAMTGVKPPRQPKLRSRRAIYALIPGYYLPKVMTPARYVVSDLV